MVEQRNQKNHDLVAIVVTLFIIILAIQSWVLVNADSWVDYAPLIYMLLIPAIICGVTYGAHKIVQGKTWKWRFCLPALWTFLLITCNSFLSVLTYGSWLNDIKDKIFFLGIMGILNLVSGLMFYFSHR